MPSQIKSTYIIHKNPQCNLKSSKAQIILAEDLKLKSHSMLETVHFLFFLIMDDLETSMIHFGNVKILSCQSRHSNGQFRVISGLVK